MKNVANDLVKEGKLMFWSSGSTTMYALKSRGSRMKKVLKALTRLLKGLVAVGLKVQSCLLCTFFLSLENSLECEVVCAGYHVLKSTGSTNKVAYELALQGEAQGTVVMAESQSTVGDALEKRGCHRRVKVSIAP